MTLDLTPQEWELLATLVKNELDQLPHEIHHTDSRQYREDLKARRQVLQRLLERLTAKAAA